MDIIIKVEGPGIQKAKIFLESTWEIRLSEMNWLDSFYPYRRQGSQSNGVQVTESSVLMCLKVNIIDNTGG